MNFSELVSALPAAEVIGDADVDVRGVAADSRRVSAGDVFVAYRGVAADGRDFILEAVSSGAKAIVAEGPAGRLEGTLGLLARRRIPLVVVPDGRQGLGWLSAAWHGYPSRRLVVIGVTGTDGKTTTATLISAILQAAGHETGLVSSVAANIGGQSVDTGFHTTTPDAPEIQAYLARMVAAGARYAVLESTSLGLAQQRLAGVDYDVAVITNITHEHLNDHHDSFEEYRAAKRMLFENLLTGARKPGVAKVSVLNSDDVSYAYLAAIRPDSQVSYGIHRPADVRAVNISHTPRGLSFTAYTPAGTIPIESPLLGRYNVWNLLAAVAVSHSQAIAARAMSEGVRQVRAVPGRMERIACGQPFGVVVDFAHTPNALEQALRTARELASGSVIVVFGCAGLRDRLKRPMMGEIAGRLADRVVITAEDPRTESLDAIMQQIADGCVRAGRQEGADFYRVADRQEAIEFALRQAQPGDLVLITGKGHERSMCFGTTEYPWSDQEAVKRALA